MVEGLDYYLTFSESIRGFTYGADSVELGRIAYGLPDGATIVEIGAFFGRATVILAGARKLRGNGLVHVIDAFNKDVGDIYSVEYYREALEQQGGTVLGNFINSINRAGVDRFVSTHIGMAEVIGKTWTKPIDLLYLSADISIKGAAEIWGLYAPFLRKGGIVVFSGGTDDEEPRCQICDGPRRCEYHDGNYLIVEALRQGSEFKNFREPFTCVFAERA